MCTCNFFFPYFFPSFVKKWMYSQTRICAGKECAGIALCTWGWRERCWAHVSHLLPVQLVLGSGGPSLVSSEQESPVPPSCVLGLSVPALKLLYILSGVSLDASSMFSLDCPRFTKWSVYACHTEINQVFSMESQFESHLSACRCLLTVIISSSRKHKAKSCWWAVNPTHFWGWAPACTKIPLGLGLLAVNMCLQLPNPKLKTSGIDSTRETHAVNNIILNQYVKELTPRLGE